MQILVPVDLYVEADANAFMGTFRETGRTKATPQEGAPWLRVTGFALFGEIEVKVVNPDEPGFFSRALDTLAALAGGQKKLPPPGGDG